MDTSTSDCLSEDLGRGGTGKFGLRMVLVGFWTLAFTGDLNSAALVGVFTGALITFTAPLGTIRRPEDGSGEHKYTLIPSLSLITHFPMFKWWGFQGHVWKNEVRNKNGTEYCTKRVQLILAP